MMVGDVPITRYWMIPTEVRPKMFTPHPTMSSDEIRMRTQKSLGPLLHLGSHLGTLRLHAHPARTPRIHLPL